MDGYVALIDVLGFQDLLSRDDKLEELDRYVDAVKKSVAAAGGEACLQLVLFSDSIILNTRDAEERSFEKLIEACARIFGYLTLQHVPVRGAISFGSFVRSASEDAAGGTIVAGRPIIEAYRCEQAQDWVGIILAPTAVRRLPQLATKTLRDYCRSEADAKAARRRLPWLMYLSLYHQVPMHAPRSLEQRDRMTGYAIVPVPESARTPLQWLDSYDVLWRAATRMLELAPDPASQWKCAALRDLLSSTQGSMSPLARAGWIATPEGEAFDWTGQDEDASLG